MEIQDFEPEKMFRVYVYMKISEWGLGVMGPDNKKKFRKRFC